MVRCVSKSGRPELLAYGLESPSPHPDPPLQSSRQGVLGRAHTAKMLRRDKTPIALQHTTTCSLRDSTCRFDWRLKITAHRSSRRENQATIANRTGSQRLPAFAASRALRRSERQGISRSHRAKNSVHLCFLIGDGIQSIPIDFPFAAHWMGCIVTLKSGCNSLVANFDSGAICRPSGQQFCRWTKSNLLPAAMALTAMDASIDSMVLAIPLHKSLDPLVDGRRG